jgi:hypothetical protein
MERMIACCLLLVTLAGCAGPLRLGVKVPQRELQQRLEAQFPFETQVLLFTVKLSAPLLSLEPVNERVGLRLALQAGMPGVQYQGEVAMDSGIAYRPQSGALVLVAPRLLRFHLDEMPEIFCRQVEKVVGPLVTAHLDSLPVYQLQERQARRRLKALRIEKNQVVAELGF